MQLVHASSIRVDAVAVICQVNWCDDSVWIFGNTNTWFTNAKRHQRTESWDLSKYSHKSTRQAQEYIFGGGELWYRLVCKYVCNQLGGGANLNRRVNACCFSCLFLFLPLLTRGVEGKVAGERVFGPWPILVKSCIVQNSPLSLL